MSPEALHKHRNLTGAPQDCATTLLPCKRDLTVALLAATQTLRRRVSDMIWMQTSWGTGSCTSCLKDIIWMQTSWDARSRTLYPRATLIAPQSRKSSDEACPAPSRLISSEGPSRLAHP